MNSLSYHNQIPLHPLVYQQQQLQLMQQMFMNMPLNLPFQPLNNITTQESNQQTIMTMPMTSKQSNQQTIVNMPLASKPSNQLNTFDEVLEKFKPPEPKPTKSKRPIEVVIDEDEENIEPVEAKKKRGPKAGVKRGPYKKNKE